MQRGGNAEIAVRGGGVLGLSEPAPWATGSVYGVAAHRVPNSPSQQLLPQSNEDAAFPPCLAHSMTTGYQGIPCMAAAIRGSSGASSGAWAWDSLVWKEPGARSQGP